MPRDFIHSRMAPPENLGSVGVGVWAQCSTGTRRAASLGSWNGIVMVTMPLS